MAGITLQQAQEQLDAFLAAAIACAANQEYRIAGRVYRRADLTQIQSMIDFWDNRVKALSRTGGIQVMSVSPL